MKALLSREEWNALGVWERRDVVVGHRNASYVGYLEEYLSIYINSEDEVYEAYTNWYKLEHSSLGRALK